MCVSFFKENQVRGIDTDEADFLDQIDRLKSQAEKVKRDEERRELDDYKIRTLWILILK